MVLRIACTTICLLFMAELFAKDDELRKFADCGKHKKARELAKLIITDYEQKRVTINCNSTLAKIAVAKAKEMAEQGIISHSGPGGSPNQRLIDAGFPLKIAVEESVNNVEAVQGGVRLAEDAWYEFKLSYNHRIHLLAEHPSFLKQTEIGVGFYYKWKSPHVEYWVVYMAEKKTE